MSTTCLAFRDVKLASWLFDKVIPVPTPDYFEEYGPDALFVGDEELYNDLLPDGVTAEYMTTNQRPKNGD